MIEENKKLQKKLKKGIDKQYQIMYNKNIEKNKTKKENKNMTKKEMITVEAIKTSLGRKFSEMEWKTEFPKAYVCYDGIGIKIEKVAKENGYKMQTEKVLVKKAYSETKVVRLSIKDLLEILNDIGYHEDWDCAFKYIYLEEQTGHIEFKHDEKGFYKEVTIRHDAVYKKIYWFEKA